MKSAIHATLILLAQALVLAGCNQTTTVAGEKQQIVTRGTGEVQAVPDKFRVHAVATARGSDTVQLRTQVDRQVDAVLALADELGIPEEQVTARSFRVTPEWEHQPRRTLTGYRVERPVEIGVTDMALYGRLMTGLTEAGITRIDSLGAEVSNLPELERQALALAVEDARARAETLATAAGRDLGPVLHIAEQGGHNPGPVMMAAARSAESDYRPGQQTVSQTVEVRYALD